jgi:hypothetical protein
MAIKYNEIKEKLKTDPLTQEELNIIAKIEKYIDQTIVRVFDNDVVRIDLTIASFKFMPGEDRTLNLKDTRRILMINELNQRYEEAGWKIKKELDDGLDGPNMSGSDYWTLTGKKK